MNQTETPEQRSCSVVLSKPGLTGQNISKTDFSLLVDLPCVSCLSIVIHSVMVSTPNCSDLHVASLPFQSVFLPQKCNFSTIVLQQLEPLTATMPPSSTKDSNENQTSLNEYSMPSLLHADCLRLVTPEPNANSPKTIHPSCSNTIEQYHKNTLLCFRFCSTDTISQQHRRVSGSTGSIRERAEGYKTLEIKAESGIWRDPRR